MTRHHPAYVIGYHGCSREVGLEVLNGTPMTLSEKRYDWLGRGVYFWENDLQRAQEWSDSKVAAGEYAEAFVVGALIDLGNCLDLTLRENHDYLRVAYTALVNDATKAGSPLPENQDARTDLNSDKLLRYLDCAVINFLHSMIKQDTELVPFQTVRGLFVEGEDVYPGARFKNRTHTQIAVIDANCIKAVFLPRSSTNAP